MNEAKKINAGKYKNKQRYKNKAKVIEKDVEVKKEIDEENKLIIEDDRLFQKRGLQNNWYRYEPKQEEEEDTSRDFAILASAPITQASYFQFKSDKSVTDPQDIKQVDNKVFELDVNLLNLSLVTVPFHTRCGIETKHFSVPHLKILKQQAEENLSKYDTYLKSKEQVKNCQEKEDQIMLNQVTDGIQNLTESISVKDDSKHLKSAKTVGNNENLEEWLDDILDD